jgi:leucyl-tRNA synthetase
MSKSRGNVVNPDEIVQTYGADTLRGYLMFIGPWDEGGPWNPRGIEGISRFLARVWALVTEPADARPAARGGTAAALSARDLEYWMHRTIRRVTDDMEGFRFNTALAALMEFTGVLQSVKGLPLGREPLWHQAVKTLVLLLAPLCPHIAEELWVEHLGQPYSVHDQPWPAYDPAKATAERIALVLQVNGRVRDRVEVEAGISEEQARQVALSSPRVRRHLDGKTVTRVIVVPGRLVNVVVQ